VLLGIHHTAADVDAARPGREYQGVQELAERMGNALPDR